MKFTLLAIKPLSPKRLIEPVGWILSIPKQQHRPHAPFHEPPRHPAQQKPPKPAPLHPPQQINLVQFAFISRNPAIVRRSLGKAHQLSALVFDHETKPAPVRPFKRLAPLLFPQFVRRPSTPSARCVSSNVFTCNAAGAGTSVARASRR